MSSDLTSMVYVSSATHLFSPTELHDLLEQSRKNNTAAGITGMLLYANGNFIQAVEGPSDAVETLERRLKLDRRHSGVIILWRGTVQSRQFGSWSMGYKGVEELSPDDQQAVREVLSGSGAASGSADTARRLLRNFSNTMR